MTKEEKELLLKDLCARLPYGVKVEITHWKNRDKGMIDSKRFRFPLNINKASVLIKPTSDIRPYLFPLSSMTEEQKSEYNSLKHNVSVCHYEYGDIVEEVKLYDSPESFNYLIVNHFDYYGLIPMGLANDATGLNIY